MYKGLSSHVIRGFVFKKCRGGSLRRSGRGGSLPLLFCLPGAGSAHSWYLTGLELRVELPDGPEHDRCLFAEAQVGARLGSGGDLVHIKNACGLEVFSLLEQVGEASGNFGVFVQ